ncbi:MAG: peptide chain release factor 1, partial [bacterium]
DMKKLAQEDSQNIQKEKDDISESIENLIKEGKDRPDPNDSKNTIMEIRAGAGGDESSLFASDLFRMYSNFAKNKGFEITILSQHMTDSGGLKEMIIKIEGKSAYGLFKWESGVHRVQRIPTTESSGRIHTSTASVAVLPEVNNRDIEIKSEDLRIDTFRSSGAGGQCVNKTESAVRITHSPTNITVSCQDSKSQLQNREMAMTVLRSRIYELEEQKKQEEQGSLRHKQIGSAMRAEKIRTYNFPQSRITDHRLKKSWYNLEGVLNGNLDEIVRSFKGYGN